MDPNRETLTAVNVDVLARAGASLGRSAALQPSRGDLHRSAMGGHAGGQYKRSCTFLGVPLRSGVDCREMKAQMLFSRSIC